MVDIREKLLSINGYISSVLLAPHLRKYAIILQQRNKVSAYTYKEMITRVRGNAVERLIEVCWR